jgi:hypothetical protein
MLVSQLIKFLCIGFELEISYSDIMLNYYALISSPIRLS